MKDDYHNKVLYSHNRSVEKYLTTVETIVDDIIINNPKILTKFPKYDCSLRYVDYVKSQLNVIKNEYENNNSLTPIKYVDSNGEIQIEYPYKWSKKNADHIVKQIDIIINDIDLMIENKKESSKLALCNKKTEKERIQIAEKIAMLPYNKDQSKITILKAANSSQVFIYDTEKDILYFVVSELETLLFDNKNILCVNGSYKLKKPSKLIFTQSSFESIKTFSHNRKNNKPISKITMNNNLIFIATND